jgi:hypothetical protein
MRLHPNRHRYREGLYPKISSVVPPWYLGRLLLSAMIENPSAVNPFGLEPSLAEIAEAMRDETESPADQPFIQFVSMVDDHEWCSVDQVVIQSTSGGVARVAFRSDSNDRNPFLIAMPEAIASSMIHQLQKRFELRKKYPGFFPETSMGNQ